MARRAAVARADRGPARRRRGGDRDAVRGHPTRRCSSASSPSRVVDALAGQGVIGTFASPRDPGTASIAWHHSSGRLTGYPGAWTYVRGGMGRVSFALADAAREAGAVIATGVPVGAIRPGEGVELEDGTLVQARAVVCNADPRRALALLDGAAPPRLPRARRGRAVREPGAEGQLRAHRASRRSRRPTTPRAGRSTRPAAPTRWTARAGSRRRARSPTSCGASCTSRPSPTRASRPRAAT